jgi:hypothetical protein
MVEGSWSLTLAAMFFLEKRIKDGVARRLWLV